jgi:hypothetical protein
LNQDETPPVEAVSQRHQQQEASGETELGRRWHEPGHCDSAREGGFHDAEHGLIVVMLAAATPHAIAITSVMPKRIDGDGRGVPATGHDRS